jgi:3-deoxy-D-manno-octulosonic acid hydroxylase-like protein
MAAVVAIAAADAGREQALRALEEGNVVFFPGLAFKLEKEEMPCLSPALAGSRKNVSLNPGEATGSVLNAMMSRFAAFSQSLLQQVFPRYAPHLIPARTSFRPVEIEHRQVSWRKDDTRLHVDSFPSTPVHGRRILRVFSNVNPEGQGRLWRLGAPFESLAPRFLPGVPRPLWGSSALLYWCGITKSRRSAYDHFMLQLHDRMKADAAYQQQPGHESFEFPAGSTWIAFTDQVAHAAMRGQHAFEQTYYLPLEAMADASTSPLRVLERFTGRRLV